MFNMNNPLLQNFLRSQMKNLKKVKIEMKSEKSNSKNSYRVKDQSFNAGEACLTLEDTETGEICYLNVKIKTA